MGRTIYAFGGERLGRVTRSLGDEYDVVYQSDVLERWQRTRFFGPLLAFVVTYLFLRRERPVVLADEFGLRRLVLLLLCRHLGCVYLSRIRGGMWNEFRDYASYRDRLSNQLHVYKDELIRNAILRWADRILAVSYFNRMQIVYELGVDPDRIEVVYESCDLETFGGTPRGRFRAETGLADDAGLLLTVTNFDYREKVRGIEYFFPVVREVLRANSNWHYVVAGKGSFFDETRRRVLAACDEDLRDRVSFVGFHSPVAPLFVDADVVLHPSFRDAMPNTVIEAQVAGKPVVVNSDGGMQESLPDEFRHYQVVDEREEFRESIETLIADPELRRTIGEKNREVAERLFCDETVSAMFDRALARATAPSG